MYFDKVHVLRRMLVLWKMTMEGEFAVNCFCVGKMTVYIDYYFETSTCSQRLIVLLHMSPLASENALMRCVGREKRV